jgi:hypothetical protein
MAPSLGIRGTTLFAAFNLAFDMLINTKYSSEAIYEKTFLESNNARNAITDSTAHHKCRYLASSPTSQESHYIVCYPLNDSRVE